MSNRPQDESADWWQSNPARHSSPSEARPPATEFTNITGVIRDDWSMRFDATTKKNGFGTGYFSSTSSSKTRRLLILLVPVLILVLVAAAFVILSVTSTSDVLGLNLGSSAEEASVQSPPPRLPPPREAAVGGSFYDGPALVRRDRLMSWYNYSKIIPDFASIPSQRRFTPAAQTVQAVQDALVQAAAARGGDRLVIIPSSAANPFRGVGTLVPPDNAEPESRIIVAWSRIVDNSFPITRDVRVPHTPPSDAPLFETPDFGVSNLNAVIDFGNGGSGSGNLNSPNQTNYFFFGLHLRVRQSAPAARYCPALILYGNSYGTIPDPLGPNNLPTRNVFSHLWMGGRAFLDDGTWRANNLGRTFYHNAGALALYDSVDIEHGAVGSFGSDRGIIGSISATGPTIVRNIYTDLGGGIVFLSGGDDAAKEPWVNFEDFELTGSLIHRDIRYHPTRGQLDSAGQRCPWVTKNMFETKTWGFVRVHRNLFLNYWAHGQDKAIILKSVNQGGNGREDSTYHVAFTENQVITDPDTFGSGAFGTSGLESYAGGSPRLNGMRQVQIRGNVFVSSRDGRCTVLSGGPPYNALSFPMRDWSFINNLADMFAGGVLAMITFRTNAFDGNLTYSRNILLPRNSQYPIQGTTDQDSSLFGFNGMFRSTYWIQGPQAAEVVDNVYPSANGQMPDSSWSERGALQHYFPGDAEMGLTLEGTGWQRIYRMNPDSPLRTLARDSKRIGPDLETLEAVRQAILAGDIRGYVPE